MPGYLLMNADVSDPDGYEEYKVAVAGIIASHGGRYLVRGGSVEPLEGRWHPRAVLVEFPSYEDALAFYNSADYRAVRGLRQRSADSCLLAMEGLPAR